LTLRISISAPVYTGTMLSPSKHTSGAASAAIIPSYRQINCE
jgi:hypothetical protein